MNVETSAGEHTLIYWCPGVVEEVFRLACTVWAARFAVCAPGVSGGIPDRWCKRKRSVGERGTAIPHVRIAAYCPQSAHSPAGASRPHFGEGTKLSAQLARTHKPHNHLLQTP